jgi:hypothetical protein
VNTLAWGDTDVQDALAQDVLSSFRIFSTSAKKS